MTDFKKKIKTADGGVLQIGPFNFSLVIVNGNEERISVVYPGDYGMVRIIFPLDNYCEDWIRDNEIIWICDKCGEVTDIKGIIEGVVNFLDVCEDCFEKHMDETYGKGNWKEYYVSEDGTEKYYFNTKDGESTDEYVMTFDAQWKMPKWYENLIKKKGA